MDEVINELEERSRGLELQAAILHILDGRHHNIVLSEATLNLEDPQIEKYVKRYVNRCKNDMRARPGTFQEESTFAQKLSSYFSREIDLPAFSAGACENLIHYLEHEEARSFDVLFVDYRINDVPYLAVVLLEETETMTCFTSSEHGKIVNTVSFSQSALPAFSKPVSSFAVINMINQDIYFTDEAKWKDKEPVLADVLLGASAGISKKEVVSSVKEITNEIAEEFHENPAVLLSKVKNYIAETVSEGLPLKTEVLVEEVFDQQPEMKEVFLEKAEKQVLPKEVELPKAAVTPSLKKQHIKTNTGIEIAFPSEYFANDDFIEFRNHPDGTITIEIKKIEKITNKL